MAVVLTLVQTKQLRMSIHKRNNTQNTIQTIQNTVNTIHVLPKHPHKEPHITQQFKTNTVQDS